MIVKRTMFSSSRSQQTLPRELREAVSSVTVSYLFFLFLLSLW